MKNYKIVEYRPEYAASLAEMWNMSSENWGGYDTLLTAEDVIEENRNSGNINAYLALAGEEVVGICTLSRFREDEGALYIPLLNVRPDYQGKKVGKALVLKVVERVVELDWPRLDLYTWPGNTKAVPLYKKCGFFWEKRDDSTHLMNFIPSVLKTEPLMDFFTRVDWYRDSQRPIEIVPDGAREDDYSYYEYRWEKDGRQLRVQYERKARGLRLIETDDYLISAAVEEKEPVAGFSYQVSYEIVNKSNRELDISIKGLDDKNISFDYQATTGVKNSLTLTAEFELGEIEEEQNRWKTHPAVTAEITINGEKALFRVGVRPRYPVALSLSLPERELFLNTKQRCYLNLENGFKEGIEVELELPGSKLITFSGGKKRLELRPEEKLSIPLDYILHGYHFYSGTVSMVIKTGNGRYRFEKKITAPFRGRGTTFGGESEKEWILCNGEYIVTLNKDDNLIKVRNNSSCRGRAVIMFPRLVKRGSQEFGNRRPVKVSFEEGASLLMKADYHSEQLPGVIFRSVISLSADGLMKNYYEVINQGKSGIDRDIWVSQPVFFDLIEATLPLEDGCITSPGSEASDLENWDFSKLSENWLFSRETGVTRGVNWPDGGDIAFHEWYFTVDFKLEGLGKGEQYKTAPVIIAWDTFKNWKELQAFALKRPSRARFQAGNKVDLTVNNGNPFIEGEFEVKLKQYKKSSLSGRAEISSEKGTVPVVREVLTAEKAVREKTVKVPLAQNAPGPDILKVQLDFDSLTTERKRAVFATGNDRPGGDVISEEGQEVYSFTNGPLEIKVAPGFSAALSSLTYQDREWLDSSFPSAGPRSWWNPWTGGITSRPEGMKNISFQEGSRTAGFCEVADNRGNLWQGLRVDLSFEGNPDFKGLEIEQYYLMLPGLPLLMSAGVIVQNTGTHYNRQKFITEIFLNPADDIRDCWFETKGSGGASVKYRAGRVAYDILSEKSLYYGASGVEEGLQVYQTGVDQLLGVTNLSVNGCFVTNIISLENGGKAGLPPTFLFFSDEHLADRSLTDLDNIRLMIEG